MRCFKRGAFQCDSDSCKFEDTHSDDTHPECEMDVTLGKMGALSFEQQSACILEGVPSYLLETCKDQWEFMFKGCTSRERQALFRYATYLEYAPKFISKFDCPNFVYDRKSKLIFFEFDSAGHSMFMNFLYWINVAKTTTKHIEEHEIFNIGKTKMFSIDEYAEKFILDGMGFYSSSVCKGMGIPRTKGFAIEHSVNHKLTYQEKAIFKNYRTEAIERSIY